MDIFEFLANHGIEVGEERREGFRKEFFEQFKTAAEVTRNAEKAKADKERIAELEAQVDELNANIAKLDGESGASADTIAELQKQVEAYKAADDERKAAAKAKADREAFDGIYAEALEGFAKKGRTLNGGLVGEAVAEKAYKMHGENPAMGIADIIEAITKDDPSAWANPQQDPKNMPKPGAANGDKLTISTREDIKKLSTQQINDNWDTISKILSQGK